MKYSHLTHYTILILLCQRGGFFIAYGQESEGEINAIIDYIDLSSHDPQGTAVLGDQWLGTHQGSGIVNSTIAMDASQRIEFKGYRLGVIARYPSLRECRIPSEDEGTYFSLICPKIGDYQIAIDTLIGEYIQSMSQTDKEIQLIMLHARKEEVSHIAPDFLKKIVASEKADGQLFIEYTQYMIDMYTWLADNHSVSLLPSLTQD